MWVSLRNNCQNVFGPLSWAVSGIMAIVLILVFSNVLVVDMWWQPGGRRLSPTFYTMMAVIGYIFVQFMDAATYPNNATNFRFAARWGSSLLPFFVLVGVTLFATFDTYYKYEVYYGAGAAVLFDLIFLQLVLVKMRPI